ncbi:MAG: hypothetical protein RL227_2842, partial [Pseudomonadota bacterium]
IGRRRACRQRPSATTAAPLGLPTRAIHSLGLKERWLIRETRPG